MTTTPRLGITQLEEGQALPEVVVNEGVVTLEQGANSFIVKDKDIDDPPGSPAEGDAYIVHTASPSGAWTGWGGRIAYYTNGSWDSVTPIEGTRAYVQDENLDYNYNGSAWVVASYLPLSGGTLTGDLVVPAESYGSGWNGSNEVPTKNDVYDKIEALIVGTGATAWNLVGTGQTATGVWDFAVDGAKANVDFAGFGSYNELLIIIDAVTGSAGTANRTIHFSTDNGSTFYTTSGNYVSFDTAGVVTNRAAATFLTASASALTMTCHLRNTKGAVKSYTSSGQVTNALFRASASDINAIRITSFTADTLNGGKIYLFGR